MGINISSDDAFTALTRRLEGEHPVTASFKRVQDGIISMHIEVDGNLQDFEIRLNRKGEWSSVLNREI